MKTTIVLHGLVTGALVVVVIRIMKSYELPTWATMLAAIIVIGLAYLHVRPIIRRAVNER